MEILNDVLQQKFLPSMYGKISDKELNIEVEKEFNRRYSQISLNSFKEEILLEYALLIKETEIKKELLKTVIDEDETNEAIRGLYNKIRNRNKALYKSRELEGIPERVIQNQEVLTEYLSIINNLWEKIIYLFSSGATHKELIKEFSINDIDKIINAFVCLEDYAEESNLDWFIDTQLVKYLESFDRANLKDEMYNPIMTLQIRADFEARINTTPIIIKQNQRKRTKETIFDWMLKQNQVEIRKSQFIESYEDMIPLYEEAVLESKVLAIDQLIYYYALERDYNFTYYHLIAEELCLLSKKKNQDLLNRIKELSIFNCYIYRSEILTNSINRLQGVSESKRDLVYESIKKELDELMILKYEIANMLTQYRDVKDISNYRIMMELDGLIPIYTKELVKETVRNLYFDKRKELSYSNYIYYFRDLVRNNANLIQERHRLIMNHIYRNEAKYEELDIELADFDFKDDSGDCLENIIFGEIDDI